MSLRIVVDDLRGPEIAALLEEHLEGMRAHSPPESVHALDLDGLRVPEITFWTAWSGDELAGCGALRRLSADHGEVKSMRTAKSFLRQGVAAEMLTHIIAAARDEGLTRLSLETGAQDPFKPAHALYRRFGFEECEPFVGYKPDPNSRFFTREL